jgi:hypothetical protein
MKKIKVYRDKEVTAYNDKDLESFDSIIMQASELWRNRCLEYLQKYGDNGTCVIGAGFKVYYLPPRCRRPRYRMVLSASSVTKYQGSFVWESSKDEIREFFRSKGLEVFYDSGNMD